MERCLLGRGRPVFEACAVETVLMTKFVITRIVEVLREDSIFCYPSSDDLLDIMLG